LVAANVSVPQTFFYTTFDILKESYLLMPPLVSIILVNYHSGAFLANCVQSVIAETNDVSYEIILVDNSSHDGVAEKLMLAFPNIRYINMQSNAGFSRANNAGIKVANGEVILLLNTDTIILNNAIALAANRLQMIEEYVAAGVQLLYADHSPQVSGSFNLTGGLNFLMTIPYIGKVLRSISLLAGVKKPSIKETSIETEVDWISGAFLMVKKSAIEKAGMLDPEFFLYHEESEWCGRLQKFGKLCLFGQLNVIHLEGASANTAFTSNTNAYSNLSDKKGLQLLVSMLLRIRKQFGLAWLLFHFMFHIISSILIIPVVLLHMLFQPLHVIAIASNGLGYSRNVWKSLPYVLRMFSGKPFFYKLL
jgi:GT2 family glycosyltransferase